MPNLHVNYSPRMTEFLVQRGAFRKEPFIVADVGARGGVEAYWRVFGNDIKGTSKNGPFSDLLSMAPDVSLVRRGLFGAISVFLPPDAQVGA